MCGAILQIRTIIMMSFGQTVIITFSVFVCVASPLVRLTIRLDFEFILPIRRISCCLFYSRALNESENKKVLIWSKWQLQLNELVFSAERKKSPK